MGLTWNDLLGIDHGYNVAKECRDHFLCKGFSYNLSSAWASGKFANGPLEPSPGSCFYERAVQVPAEFNGCPRKLGFAAFPGYVDAGSDVLQVNTTAAMEACNVEARCQGFDERGALKASLSLNSTDEPGRCLYVKMPAGFVAISDVDRSDDGIGSKRFPGDLRAAAAYCRAEPLCRGFNSDGWVKKGGSPDTIAIGACFYIKVPQAGSCPRIAGYVEAADVDHAGDDLGSLGVSAPASCRTEVGCAGFNSHGFAKADATFNREAPEVCFYTRTPAGTPKPIPT
ncbi:hypothetical protein GPECTOR_15g338 [Gonium pectorale]|uniref:Apple domain-containing protein n=1 Tax=Gonium pectorale TaxID=33097 RepID=A0A150GLH5_GONPE|nr:hypothetical protein GPECTOR_15g338 [Gonium pectorale]|eukprot:KXZ50654.1 hypothetical protein GPECTOR_15g338 [Gonium pectorale]